jgi:hypothetical protein
LTECSARSGGAAIRGRAGIRGSVHERGVPEMLKNEAALGQDLWVSREGASGIELPGNTEKEQSRHGKPPAMGTHLHEQRTSRRAAGAARGVQNPCTDSGVFHSGTLVQFGTLHLFPAHVEGGPMVAAKRRRAFSPAPLPSPPTAPRFLGRAAARFVGHTLAARIYSPRKSQIRPGGGNAP